MKSWIKKTFGFGLASFFSDLGHEMTISFIPILVVQFVGPTQTPFFLGIIASTSDGFASFLRIFSGYLTDRLPRKKPLIMLGYGISALFSMMVVFANSIWTILAYRTLSFAGNGLREPPRDALIATIIEPKNYGRAFGLKSAMDTLGALIGPLVTFLCIGIFSMHEIFILSCIPGMLAVASILFFTQDAYIPQQKTQSPSSVFNHMLQLPLSFIIFIAILFVFDISCFNKLLLLSRAQEILIIDQANIAQYLVLLYAFFNITRACSEFTIGLLSDFVNRILLLAFFGCGTFAGAAFLLMAPHGSFTYCCCIFALAGISAATISTLKNACAADMLPENIRGLGYGVLHASGGFAALISSSLIGFLWTRYSPSLAFSYVIACSLTAMIALIIFTGLQLTKK